MSVPYDYFDYPSYWAFRRYENEAEKIAISYLFRKIGKKDSLAEIGSGFGRLVPFYSDFAKEIVLADPSENLLQISQKKFGQQRKIKFIKTSLPKLSLPNSSFDVVVMVRVIHHLKDTENFFNEISRILKPDGFFVLELANKIHFLARVRELLKGNFFFTADQEPLEMRSKESIASNKILFLNHHPQKIIKNLKAEGFIIEKILSVSNFRNPIIKKFIPLKVLLFLERYSQRFLANLYFGPSIFILARKAYSS